VHLLLRLMLTLFLASSALCLAQTPWPARPVRIVVPFSPGAFTDIAARAFGTELSAQLGQAFVVDNRTGAGGILGMDIVAKATPDGYTLLVTDNSLTITPALYKKLPYDPLRDLAHIGKIAESPTLLIAALKIPAKTVSEVIELARSRPGELTFGSGGQGSAAHLAMELLLSLGKAKMTHVPFKGVALSIAGVVASQIDFSFGSLAAAMPHVNAGRVRGIALSGNARSPLLTSVPTFAEAGYPGYSFVHWWSMAAPAATPPAVVARIGKEMATATASERLRNAFQAQGATPIAGTPAEMRRLVETEIQLWRRIIESAGIRVE
jgi:tripartite-type tricarboxylate transporter receptor subunit TctC